MNGSTRTQNQNESQLHQKQEDDPQDDHHQGDQQDQQDPQQHDKYLIQELEIPCVYHDPTFLSDQELAVNDYYQLLKDTIPWQKTSKINRWVRLYQELEKNEGEEEQQQPQQGYTYKDAPQEEEDEQNSNNNKNVKKNMNGNVFPELVQQLRLKCQEWYALNHPHSITDAIPSLNVCLLNFYEDGQQRIGWHADREEIGRTTPIMSISLGAERQFLIRSQTNGRTDRCSLTLRNGSLTMMTPECQLHYLHSVPKESEVSTGRINLTFRCKDKLKMNSEQTTNGEVDHERRDNFIDRITEGIQPTTKPWTAATSTTTTTTTTAAIQSSSSIFGEEEDVLEQKQERIEEGAILTRFVIKTNMGAERYCAAEIRERIHGTAYTTKHNSIIGCQQDDDDDNGCYCYQIQTRPFDLDGYISVIVYKIAVVIINNNDDAKNNDKDEANDKANTVIVKRVRDLLLELKTAHHVLHYHCHFRLRECFQYVPKYLEPGLDIHQQQVLMEDMKEEKIPKETLYEYVKDHLTNEAISFLPHDHDEDTPTTTTFRVTSDRVGGPHAFQTPEVEYEIGGAIAEAYEHKGWVPKMTNYDLCIRADIIAHTCLIGTQCNIQDLSKGRHFQRYRNAVTIKTNLAYAMIRLANIRPGDKVMDPFCGSGTLLLEALELHHGHLQGCVGMDVSRRSANGARDNAEAEGYASDIVNFVCSDARSLRRHVTVGDESGDGTVDAIVSNLPWGIMTGQKQSVSSLQTLYEVFLRNAWYVLKPGGRIVLLVLRGLQIMRIVRKLSGRFQLLHLNVVRTTNNLPSLVVMEKLPTDLVRDNMKGQLAHLNQYVNVSPEIYQSIHNEEVEEDDGAPMVNRGERKQGGGGGGSG